jgi:hypothetical protein
MKYSKTLLEDIIEALDNADWELEYYFNKKTQEVVPISDYFDENMRTEESLTGEDWVEIEGLESYKKFDLMEEFAEQQETEVANALLQALGGKGSFRRFKDVLINYPAVQKEWYEFEHKWLEAKANEFLDEIYENDGGEGE